MVELYIPDGTIAERNRNTEIRMDEGQTIETGTAIKFDNLGEFTVDGFYEVLDNDVDAWVKLYGCESGIFGIDMVWSEIPNRIQAGDAEVVDA